MAQENYLSACPQRTFNTNSIKNLLKAANAFVSSDLLDKTITKSQSYTLMPNRMFMSCVYPAETVCESLGAARFAKWLGSFSS